MLIKKIDKIIDSSNKWSKEFRSKYFKIIIKALDKSGATANSLSFLRALSGVLFFLFVNVNFTVAFIIIVLGGLTDFFDGALARLHGKDSDRGKFIDMLCDNLLFTFFLFGLMKIEFIGTLNLAYFIFIIPALYLMVIVDKNEYQKNDWIIQPYARVSYYKVIFEICFLLVVIFGISRNILNLTTLILDITMTLHFSYHFYCFLNKKT